jgi:hypothetical protein
VLPIGVVEQTANGRGLPLVVHCVDAGLDRRVFVAREPDNVLVRRGGLPCVVIAVTSQPRPHGIIRSQPPTLRHLHDFLADGGVDLVGQLRERLLRWRTQGQLDGFSLIVVVALPKSRQIGGPAEDTEYRAFLCDRELARLRPEIGLVRRDGRAFGAGIVDGVDRVKMGEAVGLLPLDVTFSLGRDRAAELNGREGADGRRIVAVGVGALGSQVVMNLVRAGWGTWTLIDDDVLLPHNLARHASIGPAVGGAKAVSMQSLANWVVDGNPVERAVVADVLAPERNAAQVGRALGAADAILDCSASVAVARHLARDVASPARRASFFLNPSGTAAVLLVEDAERTIPLDALEMQYYRTLIERPELAGHLDPGSLPFRYGGSCRDVTMRLPQDAVALFAALGSRALSVALDRPGPTILIWQANAEQLDVRSVRIQPQPVVVQRAEEWQIATDRGLLDVVAARRRDRLPNETGGVLVGAIDTLHRTVYVVDAIASPPDSTEWPTLYIRGYEGLTARLREIGAITRGMLEYVGEWHAHPNGHGCTPSKDDREAFAWLAQERRRDGRMPLMLIAGEDRFCWYLGRMPGRP